MKTLWSGHIYTLSCLHDRLSPSPGFAMLLRIVWGSLRRHLCSSSCIFSTLAGFRPQRQPLREVLPFLFSTFSKHLFRERLCLTEFFQPSGAFWTETERQCGRKSLFLHFMILNSRLGIWSEPLTISGNLLYCFSLAVVKLLEKRILPISLDSGLMTHFLLPRCYTVAKSA